MKIEKFDGEYSFLSNFYPSPFILECSKWSTVEHWYQAHKTENPSETIRLLRSPGQAKRQGRLLPLRKDWIHICIPIMYQGVKAKFDQNYELRKKLIDTGDAILIEGNNWGDMFWGVCDGKGLNNLGKVLMKVRRSYKTSQIPVQLEFNFD